MRCVARALRAALGQLAAQQRLQGDALLEQGAFQRQRVHALGQQGGL